MERREESDTAEPQKESLRDRSCGQPRERTSVAVSERAQQNDCLCESVASALTQRCRFLRQDTVTGGRGHGDLGVWGFGGERTKSNSLNPFAAFVRYTIALSVK